MPDELNDVEAKLLLAKLHRRTRLLTTLRRKPRDGLLLAIVTIALLTLIFMRTNHGSEGTFIVFIVLMGLAPCMVRTASDVENVKKRLDALIELLQEEGMLQSTPPIAKHTDER